MWRAARRPVPQIFFSWFFFSLSIFLPCLFCSWIPNYTRQPFTLTSYSSETVLGLELLDVVDGIVDQSETRGAATTYSITTGAAPVTKSNLETEEDNALIVGNVVLLGEDALKLVLGDGRALGVDNLDGLRAHSLNRQITI